MEQNIQNKVKRFLDLSVQFTKTEGELFPDYNNRDCIRGTATYTIYDGSNSQSQNSPTRTEFLQDSAEIKVQLSKDFDEYKQLQQDLKNYFSAAEKLK